MKAARLHGYRAPLVVEDVADPMVSDAFDVIVQVDGAGLCRSDLHILEGYWQAFTGIQLPYVPGHENAGTVVDVGPGVSTVSVGDRVVAHPTITCGSCSPCRAGHDMHCLDQSRPGITLDGGFAQLLRTRERALVPLPPNIEPRDVAALGDAGLTAYHAAKRAAALGCPTSVVLVIGAGGLGHLGIQSLRALTPARLIVTDTSELALGLADDLGALETVVADPQLEATLLDLTDGTGPDIIVDFVGEQATVDLSLRALRNGGIYLPVGYGGDIGISAAELMMRELSIVGNLIGTWSELAELVDLTERGAVTTHNIFYPLDAVNDAVADLVAGRVRGRAVLVPQP